MSIFSDIVYDLTQYVKRFTGTAAPSTAPDRAGSLTFDTTAKKTYASYGTSSSSDWVEVGTNDTGATIKTKLETLESPNKLSADATQDGTANKVYTATEKSKLAGIANGAKSDHGVLTGLTDDDHTQYPVITSQSGAPATTPARIGAINVDTAEPSLYYGKGTSSSDDWIKAGSVNPQYAANCRLTLESGVPVPINDREGKTILYLTKYKGNNLDLFDGTAWNRTEIDEISITNSGLAKNTIYDVFASNSAPGPALEWNFASGEGTTVIDSSGNGNHGTTVTEGFVIAPTWNATGKWDGCMYYNNVGVGAFQKVYKTGATGLPQGSNPVTISAFFKISTFINASHICGYGNYSDSVPSSLFILVSSTLLYIHTGAVVYAANWTGDNNWHHIALVLEEGKTKISEIKLYLDGVLKATSLHAGTDQDLALNGTKFVAGYPGWPTGWPGYALHGYIDSVKAYSVGLSAPQVQEIYETNTLVDANSILLSLTAWAPPAAGAITAITAASPRVASCATPPNEATIVTISGDAGEPSNNATWRVGTVVSDTSFTLLQMDGTDSSAPANAGTASTYTSFDGNQARSTELTTQDGVLVKNGDTTQRWVGTVKTKNDGTFWDSWYYRFVYNAYNQVERVCGIDNDATETVATGVTDVPGGFDFVPSFLVGENAGPVHVSANGKLATEAGASVDVRIAINSHTDALSASYAHFTLAESLESWYSLSDVFYAELGYNYINTVATSTGGDTDFSKNSIYTVIKC